MALEPSVGTARVRAGLAPTRVVLPNGLVVLARETTKTFSGKGTIGVTAGMKTVISP